MISTFMSRDISDVVWTAGADENTATIVPNIVADEFDVKEH